MENDFSTKSIFQKQGGMKLIKQYHKSGALFTAVCEYLLLGRNRTALEILRLSAQYKTRQKLEKKYKKSLAEFDATYDPSLPHKSSNKVWVCWLQGLDHAPEIVKKCYESIVHNMPDKDIILLTKENISEYVSFPDYIRNKYESGNIDITHMSDLLRLELLIRYGGMWVDATVYCSGNNIPDYFFDSDLFFYQCLKPGRDGHSTYMSSWLMSAKTNNKILMATRFLCYEYWKKNNNIIDYFMFHDFISIVLEYYKNEWNKIIPRDNSTPHILLLRLFDKYNPTIWKSIKEQTPFHKLTYKFDHSKTKIDDTFYQHLIANDI